MRASVCVVAAAIIGTLLAPAPEAGAEERLVVRVYDSVGIADEEMVVARSIASAILKEAGAEVVWRDCSHGCGEPLVPREVMLRIVRTTAVAAPGSLGYSIVDVRRKTGTLATVFDDRIRASAVRTRVAPATLLGRAAAHELAHLLLGTSEHSRTGLMRAFWSDRDLQRDVGADWIMSPADVARLSNRRLVSQPGSSGASN